MVGALRWPTRPLMPIEPGLPSVKARAGLWQVAQATVPSADKPAIEEKLHAEGDLLGGLRVVSRYRRARRLRGEADLLKRPWLG